MSAETRRGPSLWRLSPFEITLLVLSMSCFGGAAWTVHLF
jgi:hypothetical protein